MLENLHTKYFPWNVYIALRQWNPPSSCDGGGVTIYIYYVLYDSYLISWAFNSLVNDRRKWLLLLWLLQLPVIL